MATSSIQDFYSRISKYKDFARGNRFRVFMNVPSALLKNWGSKMEDLSFLCEMSELPGKNIATFDRRTYGVSEKMPIQTSFQDINLTFLCTDDKENMWQKRFFEDWMDLIHPSDTYNLRYKSDYTVYFRIVQYSILSENEESENVEKNYAVALYDAYPINMNQLGLAWADDGFLRLSMTFAYTRWERTIGISTLNSLQQNLDTPYIQQSDIPPPKQNKSLPPVGQNEINPATGNFIGTTGETSLPSYEPR